MKQHRKWATLMAYFKEIPIDKLLVKDIQALLDRDENVLVMIKKEDHESNPKYTQSEKFQALGKLFPPEVQSGKLIISAVPDINYVIEEDF